MLHTLDAQSSLVGINRQIGRRYLVVNQLSPAQVLSGNGKGVGDELAALEAQGLPVVAEMPFDDQVFEHSVSSTGILNLPDDSRALVAAQGHIGLADRDWRRDTNEANVLATELGLGPDKKQPKTRRKRR